VSVELEERLHVGPAGWQYDDWYGPMYPSPRPRGFDPLAYVASYFNLVEINSTFYRIPAPTAVHRQGPPIVHAYRPSLARRFRVVRARHRTHPGRRASRVRLAAVPVVVSL
jgi:hypothetical protein